MHMTPTLAEFAVAPLSAPTVLIRLGPPGAAAAGCSVRYSLHLRFRRPYSVESPNEPNIRTTRQLGFPQGQGTARYNGHSGAFNGYSGTGRGGMPRLWDRVIKVKVCGEVVSRPRGRVATVAMKIGSITLWWGGLS
ncbi:hypothetical protein BD779DRAFT_1476212 [Infundibulicybe gibba]|nr:hypothetical protein BD779DRAFT_1476212 [Infundibulicybe gibba]